MSDSIRVERREKRIEVNDNGEYIILPFGDQEFIPKMLELLHDFQDYAKQQNTRAAEISAMPDGTQPEELEKITATAALNLDVCRSTAERVNGLFGAEACRKIFGEGTPSLFAFADFFDQLAPIITRFADEEAAASHERIRKYSAKYKSEG